MDEKKDLLALLRSPDVKWEPCNGTGRTSTTLTLRFIRQRRLVNWCLEELARISPYVSAEAYFRQIREIKCLFPDIDYSCLSWRVTPIDRMITLASIEQERAELVKLLSSCNNAISNRAS